MHVTYDPEADAAYVYLTNEKICTKTISATSKINLDFDRDGHLIGIEILDGSLLHPDLMMNAEILTEPIA